MGSATSSAQVFDDHSAADEATLEALKADLAERTAEVDTLRARSKLELAREAAAREEAEARLGGAIEEAEARLVEQQSKHDAEAAEMAALLGQLQTQWVAKKEQYAALARRIKQYPPREQTRQEIEALEGEIAALEEDGKGIASKLELRSKQFAAFMHSVHDLQLSLAEEEQTKAGAMDTS